MEANYSQPSAGLEQFQRLGQRAFQSAQFIIYSYTQSLKGSRCRVDRLAAFLAFSAWHSPGHDLR
jgi:hypothetical protein